MRTECIDVHDHTSLYFSVSLVSVLQKYIIWKIQQLTPRLSRSPGRPSCYHRAAMRGLVSLGAAVQRRLYYSGRPRSSDRPGPWKQPWQTNRAVHMLSAQLEATSLLQTTSFANFTELHLAQATDCKLPTISTLGLEEKWQVHFFFFPMFESNQVDVDSHEGNGWSGKCY